MRTAWRALKEVLREAQGIEPAALMVLHTWNQELDHHPHIHALVPGGGPSLGGRRWRTTRHPKHRRRKKPYLVDNRLLGEKFKEHFCAGLKRLHRKGLIAFDPPFLPARVAEARDEPDMAAESWAEWLDRIAGQTWNVFIEAPPEKSQPQHMVKYLARYLTGGPISDGRLISHEQGEVTFWTRSRNKQTGNQPRPFSLPGVEFVRRWSMHILKPLRNGPLPVTVRANRRAVLCCSPANRPAVIFERHHGRRRTPHQLVCGLREALH